MGTWITFGSYLMEKIGWTKRNDDINNDDGMRFCVAYLFLVMLRSSFLNFILCSQIREKERVGKMALFELNGEPNEIVYICVCVI